MLNWIIVSIWIFTQANWFCINTLKGISCQKPPCLWIVVPALEVIQPRLLIIPVPRIAVGVLNASLFPSGRFP